MLQMRDFAAVRRPRGTHPAAAGARHLARFAAVCRDHPDVARTVEFALIMSRRDKRHLLPVGGPRWLRVIPIAVCNLLRLTARDVHNENVTPLVVDEGLSVDAVLHAVDATVRFRLLRVGVRRGAGL